MELFAGKNLPDNKGIYTYILDDSDWKTQVVETAKETLGLPQFSNQHNKHTVNSEKIPSIESWIKGFADADFVITDSFHGCVFSIIFNKPFIAIGNKDRGLSRFHSLLKIFNLESRLVSDDAELSIDKLDEINWNYVNSRLKKEKDNSLTFLKSALK